MSKVTPSALRGLRVAAGTVGLAAVGAAAAAGQACAAESGPSLAGGGLPVSTNAVPAVVGALGQNHGTIAGIPLSQLSRLPGLGRLPRMLEGASPASDALQGLGYADLGEVPLTRSRPVPGAQPHGVRTPHVARHAAKAAPAPAAPAPAAPAPAAAPAAQAAAPVAAPVPKAQTGPLDTVTNALHGLPIAGQLAGPGHSLPVVGGLSGGPLGGLGGLTGGLAGIGG